MRARVALALCVLLAACGPAPNAPHQRIIVSKRASLKTVADSLAAHGIIGSPGRFLLTARLLGLFVAQYRGLDRHLRPGRYDFPIGERTRTILGAMIAGRTDDDMFTVPEGFTIREMAETAARRLGMDSAAFVAATRDPALRAALGIPPGDSTLEGYLFPETYRVVFGASAQQLVGQMVQQFEAQWDTAWDARARQLGLTRHQAITLASIVEAEARRHSERQMIAGVYYNRLTRTHPMKLEADPTVIYALGRHVNRVMLRDLQVKSPYNTYLHTGLPPGPIDSPGRASILAVLWPARHHFLFFVARPDGSHMFSETAAQHADSVRVARRLRAEAIAARAESLKVARRDSIAAVRAAQQLRRLPPPPPVGLDSAAPRRTPPAPPR
ncbi:MAG TPA: endolytic transglycosylase MltG [Gemmatimonadales bacterium]|nr:endolytic transglycosylase MltG [Gemmatimonadales bacterium]